jgi:hypothetical protein
MTLDLGGKYSGRRDKWVGVQNEQNEGLAAFFQ